MANQASLERVPDVPVPVLVSRASGGIVEPGV
jgi:hypothetical protein